LILVARRRKGAFIGEGTSSETRDARGRVTGDAETRNV